MTLRTAIVAATVLTLAAPTARAQSTDSAAAAVDAFGAGDYERAAELFQQAYDDRPTARLLFGWAQSERLRGACDRALALYQQLLDDPNMSQRRREAVEAARAQPCTQTVPLAAKAAEPAAEPAVEPVAAPPEATAAPPPAPTARAPWYGDRLGHALLGVGVAAGAAGGYLFHRSSVTRDRAGQQPTLAGLDAMFSRAERDRAIAIGATTVGGALVIGAVVRYATGGRSSSRPIEVSAAPTAAGARLVLSGRF